MGISGYEELWLGDAKGTAVYVTSTTQNALNQVPTL